MHPCVPNEEVEFALKGLERKRKHDQYVDKEAFRVEMTHGTAPGFFADPVEEFRERFAEKSWIVELPLAPTASQLTIS